ncbi:WD40 repeat domain-containing protein [Breznakiellaceae bacterium SP9]
MKRSFLLPALLLCLRLSTLYAQVQSLDESINDAARYINTVLPQGAKVAVLSFSSGSEALGVYVNTKLIETIRRNPLLTVVERRILGPVLNTLHVSYTAKLSDSQAQRIAQQLGAQVFAAGSFSFDGLSYQLRVQALASSSLKVLWSKAYTLSYDVVLSGFLQTPEEAAAALPRIMQAPQDASIPAPLRVTASSSPAENFVTRRTLSGHSGGVNSISANGRQLVSASDDGTVRVWDIATGAVLKTLSGQAAAIICAAFSPDGRYVASGANNRTIRIWDLSDGSNAYQILTGHGNDIVSLSYSRDGKQLLSSSSDRTIKVWDAASGKELKSISLSSTAFASAFSPDGKLILAGTAAGTVKVFDVERGLEQRSLSGHTELGIIRAVAWRPDGKQFVSGASDNNLIVWELDTGRALWTLYGHNNHITSVAYSPDGKRLVSGSRDHDIKVWDPASGYLLKTLAGHTGAVSSLTFTADGKRLISASGYWYSTASAADTTIKIWGE